MYRNLDALFACIGVRCAKNRDNNIIDNLIVIYNSPVVQSVCCRISKALTTAKRCPSADFDDLYSDGLMGLLKAIRYYDEKKGASFATFASLCVDTSMKTCVAKALKISPANKDDDFDFDSLQDEGKSTDDIIIDKEQNGEFYKKLGEILTDKEMAVLDMYLRHYSYQQIGETLGIKEKSVDNALQRAKSKIKHNLGK